MAKRTSIFAQRMKIQREEHKNALRDGDKHSSDVFGTKSFILSGEDAHEIHKANIQKLSEMTSEQIIEERNKLLTELNPNLVNFIRGRRKRTAEISSLESALHKQFHSLDSKPSEASNDEAMDTSEPPKDGRDIPEVVVEEVKELAKYPHMDVVEKEKLQWIGELPLEIQPPSDPYAARFNFEGELLPYSDKGEGVLLGLHNHGEEPERPGYTLQELIQLSRSSVLQQRVIALNTLAKIMEKYHLLCAQTAFQASQYDECFSEPILPVLLEAEIFFLLRFSLDDPAPPVVMASASALCNLIVNQVDEACLDSLLGTPMGLQQPSLGVVLDMKQSDIDELKDQQLLKLDIIRGALRTDLLQRIKYILTELQPEPLEIKQLLKALIRMSRHSFEVANGVFTFPGLLEAVRSLLNVQSSKSFYPEALKLFRIIASRSRTLASAIHEKYEIQKPIFTFIAGERAYGHREAMHLKLESFYTWQSLLNYNIAIDTIGSVSPLLMRIAETHFGLTNIDGVVIDLEHASALISTIGIVAKLNFSEVRHILPLLLQAATKWLTQFLNIINISFSAFKLLGCCLNLFAATLNDFDGSAQLLPVIEKIISGPCMKSILTKLKRSSWLIHGRIISSPENLPCLGCKPPTIDEESSLPFVYAMALYILASKKNNLMESFLGSSDLLNYVRSVLKGDNITKLCGHWYARQELNILVILVHMFTIVDIREHQNMFHRLAFRLLTSVQMGDKVLLPEIISKTIFNPKYFSSDVDSVARRLEELRIGKHSDSVSKLDVVLHTYLENAIKILPEIEKLYIRELGLEGLVAPWPPVTLTGILNSTQSALPLDWPFMPILRLHERQGNDKNAASIVNYSLQWLIIIEKLLPDAFSLNYTAKYCRLCCVYLAGNDLFQDVTPILELALYCILRHKEEINFEKPIPGLTSFYDFYRELLEQFAGVSYGNTVFGQFVLVPLQQRHSEKYKKIIWSELAAVLRLLKTPIDTIDMKDYLVPCETDESLLRTYLHSVGTGRIRDIWCPVLYQVAVHHVATYVKNNSDKLANVLQSMINSLGNQELKNLLLNYNGEYLR